MHKTRQTPNFGSQVQGGVLAGATCSNLGVELFAASESYNKLTNAVAQLKGSPVSALMNAEIVSEILKASCNSALKWQSRGAVDVPGKPEDPICHRRPVPRQQHLKENKPAA